MQVSQLKATLQNGFTIQSSYSLARQKHDDITALWSSAVHILSQNVGGLALFPVPHPQSKYCGCGLGKDIEGVACKDILCVAWEEIMGVAWEDIEGVAWEEIVGVYW